MTLDLPALARAVAEHGAVVRVLVLRAAGSVPREAGVSMLVWPDGEEGTIGGGALEWEAILRAREMLEAALRAPEPTAEGSAMPGRAAASGATGRPAGGPAAAPPMTGPEGGRALRSLPLGPALGQCCGGSVTLLWEMFDAGNLPDRLPWARAIAAQEPPPAPLAAALAAWRPGQPPAEIGGWLVEGAPPPRRPLWIWGAGHVGRALAEVLAPLPDWEIVWADIAPDRFPDAVPPGVTILPAADLPRAAAHAPVRAEHLIVTLSHDADLALCHALLNRGFSACGLIGSATKWARFRSRLRQLGHAPAQIARIACPIGDPALGKHPQAIAVGVAAALLLRERVAASAAAQGDGTA